MDRKAGPDGLVSGLAREGEQARGGSRTSRAERIDSPHHLQELPVARSEEELPQLLQVILDLRWARLRLLRHGCHRTFRGLSPVLRITVRVTVIPTISAASCFRFRPSKRRANARASARSSGAAGVRQSGASVMRET